MRKDLTQTVITVLAVLLLTACVSTPVADLSATQFPKQPQPLNTRSQITVSIDPAVYKSPRTRQQTDINLRYQMGGVEKTYVEAVAGSLFKNAVVILSKKPLKIRDTVELRLTSFSHNAFIGQKGFVQSKITDEATAEWVLLAKDGTKINSFVFIGTASAEGGWGSSIAKNAQQRGNGALQKMYQRTLKGLSESTKLQHALAK